MNRLQLASLDRNQKILLILGVVLLVVLIYRLFTPYRQPTVAELTHTGRPAAAPAAAKPENGRATDPATAVVKLSVYLSPPENLSQVRRDPFTMVAMAPETPPAPAQRPPEAGPEERLRRDMQRFQVFGNLQRGQEKAIFLQRGKQVLVVRKGDRIDGRYLIEDLAEDSITVSAEGLESPVEVPLESLAPEDLAAPLTSPGSAPVPPSPQEWTAPQDEAPEDLPEEVEEPPPPEPEAEPDAATETEPEPETEPEAEAEPEGESPPPLPADPGATPPEGGG
jgi:hypothetical protein